MEALGERGSAEPQSAASRPPVPSVAGDGRAEKLDELGAGIERVGDGTARVDVDGGAKVAGRVREQDVALQRLRAVERGQPAEVLGVDGGCGTEQERGHEKSVDAELHKFK